MSTPVSFSMKQELSRAHSNVGSGEDASHPQSAIKELDKTIKGSHFEELE